MKYIGSKAKYAQYILPHIMRYRTPQQYYVEPFVGGANMMSEVSGNRIGGDTNKYMIALWKAVSEDGWMPKKSYSKREYDMVRNEPDKNLILTGYLGCVLSFSSKFLDVYARSISGDNTSGHNTSLAGYSSSLKQFPKLRGAKFYCCTYDKLIIPKNSIIYCDPPYANTYNYGTPFDSERFWRWAGDMSNAGHRVLVSEYEAPEGWAVLWNHKHTVKVNAVNGGAFDKLEKLFIKLKL